VKRLRIEHSTEYAFERAVSLLPHRIFVHPRGGHALRVASFTLNIEPTATVRWHRDALDNAVAIATFEPTLATSLRVASSVVIEQYDSAPLDFFVEPYAATYPFEYEQGLARVLAPFRVPSWPDDVPVIEPWLGKLGLRGGSIETFVLLDRLNRALHETFGYRAREEAGVQSPSSTLALGTGSCRDLAALFNDSCRAFGLASRFVSGYVHDPDLPRHQGATHAWSETYLPGAGWKGFDPTTGRLAGADHIPVAVAYHPQDVPPVSGAFLGPPQKPVMRVAVDVCAVD